MSVLRACLREKYIMQQIKSTKGCTLPNKYKRVAGISEFDGIGDAQKQPLSSFYDQRISHCRVIFLDKGKIVE
jgi:hypothetical protein